MKICFLLQRRFTYTGHAMALTFQKKYGIKEFCGYVNVRSGFEFLKSQKDLNYSALILDEDIHETYKKEKLDLAYLAGLEKEYGAPYLWPYISLDRVVRYNLHVREYPYNTPTYSHEDMMRILQVTAKAIIKFLEEEKPNVIIFSVVGNIGSRLLYEIARKKKIKTIIISGALIKTRQTITENYQTFTYANEAFKKIQTNENPYLEDKKNAKNFLEAFRLNPQPYSATESIDVKSINRRRHFSFLLPKNLNRSVSNFSRSWLSYFSGSERHDYDTVKPWYETWDKTKRKIRVLIGIDYLYDEINFQEKYAFYPLQLEPEVTTLLLAPFFIDQLWLIKQIAASLPLNFKLYVKEHPSMFGYRRNSFYKELKKIPNVKLVPSSQESFDLIKNAQIILTITGTAGWEALMLKKPVITFGDIFYNDLPMVKRCQAIAELPYLIKQQLENFHYREDILINFLAALCAESVDVDLAQLWEIEGRGNMARKEKELIPLVDLIAKKLNLKANK
ncbi:MAG: hypothetical protein PHS62_04510 [Patescibacteria group bacterium]|nr:hypothetical protein [Patescibacteria group bacterium]